MDNAVSVSCMEYAAAHGRNCFRWPSKEDIFSYSVRDILCQIDAPVPINQRGHFSISQEDLTKVANAGQY